MYVYIFFFSHSIFLPFVKNFITLKPCCWLFHLCFPPFQEFMAALYVFLMFYLESKNILESSSPFTLRYNNKSAADLVQCALARIRNSSPGRYDMFLRYLCGLLSPACHKLLQGFLLYRHNTTKVTGLDEVEQLLEQAVENAPSSSCQSLKECLREMLQEDE